MRRRPGFLLIMVLMVATLLSTMGLGFLGSRAGQYQSTAQSVLAIQARGLARSGLEDVRVKLNHDSSFPPTPAMGQTVFSYAEDLSDTHGVFIGSYRIKIDSTFLGAPYSLLNVTSTGLVGPRGAPTAAHTYRAYIDLDPASPLYFQIVRWDDLGTQ